MQIIIVLKALALKNHNYKIIIYNYWDLSAKFRKFDFSCISFLFIRVSFLYIRVSFLCIRVSFFLLFIREKRLSTIFKLFICKHENVLDK